MATFEELLNCLIPPEDPVGIGAPEDWRAFEQRIGFTLPSDYKRIVSTFGYGAIENELYVKNPFVNRIPTHHFETEVARQRAVYELNVREGFLLSVGDERRTHFRDEPMPAGLLPWGGDGSGGTAFWETNDPDPERWTMYIFDGSDAYRYPENLTTFIVTALRGRDTPLFWPGWRCPARYVSWRTGGAG